MRADHLVCPRCRCPLEPPAGSASGMICPRCNTWLEIDPACSGSCLGCPKLNRPEPDACVDSGEEISRPVVVQK